MGVSVREMHNENDNYTTTIGENGNEKWKLKTAPKYKSFNEIRTAIKDLRKISAGKYTENGEILLFFPCFFSFMLSNRKWFKGCNCKVWYYGWLLGWEHENGAEQVLEWWAMEWVVANFVERTPGIYNNDAVQCNGNNILRCVGGIGGFYTGIGFGFAARWECEGWDITHWNKFDK